MQLVAKMMRPPEPPPLSASSPDEKDDDSRLHQNNSLLDEDELESVDDYVEKVIYVRTMKVGYLIGTSGRTIRGFESNSGAKIDILKPNSCADETPVLLSGPCDSVRNVLRMIIDLYHLNNLSSELWQHLRNNEMSHEDSNPIYGHEEMVVQASFLSKLSTSKSQLENEFGVHLDIGKEREDCPGLVAIGLIGTAEQNYRASEHLKAMYEKFCTSESQGSVAKVNANNNRLDPFSPGQDDELDTCLLRHFSSLTAAGHDIYKETVKVKSKDMQVNQSILQPICKLNNVTMETVKAVKSSPADSDLVQVIISGPEINVKRAKLQLLHNVS